MWTIFESVIRAGGYDLAAMLGKIDTVWAEGRLGDEERAALATLAREKAAAEDSYAPLGEQVENAFARIAALQDAATLHAAQIAALNEALAAMGGTVPDPEPPEADEWPAYVQPAGAHDAYHTGDKVTFNGKKYLCTAPEGVACVWSPEVYPTYWAEQAEGGESA